MNAAEDDLAIVDAMSLESRRIDGRRRREQLIN